MNTKTTFTLILLLTLAACGKHKGSGSSKANPNPPILPEACPTGFIQAPGNFCVMKYEAKEGTDGKPVSQADLTPWTGTYAEDAKEACQSLGPKYDLISNEEWMIIAQDAEVQDANWTGGVKGSGCLFRGNNGQPAPWNPCGYGDGAGGIHFGDRSAYESSSRAKMVLSNGEEIWDMAGNVSEWIDWTKGGDFDLSPLTCSQTSRELKDIAVDEPACSLSTSEYMPSDITLTSAQGAGKFLGGAGGYTRRGGASWSGDSAGIYALNLERGSANNDGDNGFRCVYRF